MAKVTRKKQGSQVDASAMSSANVIKDPEHLGRGLGTAYAYAVDTLKEQAKLYADKSEFLGVKKEQVNPYENMHSSLLPKDFNPGNKA